MTDYRLLRKAFGQKILGSNSLLEQELADEFSIVLPAQQRVYLHPEQESTGKEQPLVYSCKFRGIDIGDTRDIGFKIESSLAELRAYREAIAERPQGTSLIGRVKIKITGWLTGLTDEDLERLKLRKV